MQWNICNTLDSLTTWLKASEQKPVLFFKHSTRCSISSMALSRLERKWDNAFEAQVSPVFIDLISFRAVSNQIAEKLAVTHQSPQVLLVKDGQCIYHASHGSIALEEIIDQL